ncbi:MULTISPECIES: HmuY family protein [Niastella]|uniref:HmuY family protein n=1 Tax=Niastella soli TaxID=2821487 RepID=A0ABS3YMP9_9BACT|nr:HmuY family protein [Niastella soli]MBO9199174.1 HmuY family protein [Niastella soli]
MRHISLWIAAALVVTTSACKKDSDSTPAPLEAKTVTDINANPADNGGFSMYFNLTTGTSVPATDSATNKWDIAFKTTTIKVNSGTSGPGTASAQLVTTGFDDLIDAPENGYATDGATGFAIPAGTGNGWYSYTGAAASGPQHAILPIAGKTIVVKTVNGKYAKIQIVSYYKGNPNVSTAEFADLAKRPLGGYYTIRYMVQADGSRKLK